FILEYGADSGGTLSGTTEQEVEFNSNSDPVTAVTAAGYESTKWSDDSTSTPRVDMNVKSDASVHAVFDTKTYTLTYSASTGGTVSGNKNQTVAHGSDGSTVTAVANSGYMFEKWSDGITTNPRKDTNVTSNKTIIAQFKLATTTVVD